jgi:hypothetical protein
VAKKRQAQDTTGTDATPDVAALAAQEQPGAVAEEARREAGEVAGGGAPSADGAAAVPATVELPAVRVTVELPTVPAPDAAASSAAEPSFADGATTQLPIPEVAAPFADGATTQLPIPEVAAAMGDGADEEADGEWALADQPTVALDPQLLRAIKPEAGPETPSPRPAFLETGEVAVWPPRPGTPTPPGANGQPPVARGPNSGPLGRPLQPIPRPVVRTGPLQPRIPSPSGRAAAGAAAAISDPRMARLVELRLQRGKYHEDDRAPDANVPVAQLVRQWWHDLAPGVRTALHAQHEARASGVYPLPAHVAAPATRLGDAFGRLAAAVRDLGERAQAAASPTLTRLHDGMEHAAQALVERIEGPPGQQQGPLLGPGRLAVFFQQGVTVGQAQRLLATNRARPMRLIPKRHGFLALVPPGRESEVGEHLRVHPYVRDVVYLEYDENGGPRSPR